MAKNKSGKSKDKQNKIDARDDFFAVGADKLLKFDGGNSLLENDIGKKLSIVEVDGVPLGIGKTVTLDSGATLKVNKNGTFDFNPNGQYAHLKAGEVAYETFTYKVMTKKGGFDTATVKIKIEGSNHTPIANEDAFSIAANGKLTVGSSSSVLKNDTDANGDPLQIVAVNGSAASVGQTITLASGAKVKLNADGTFDYDPNGKFAAVPAGGTAIDTFTYKISDGNGGFDTTVVKIRVEGTNDQPVANEDGFAVAADGTLTVGSANSVLKNDTDADWDALAIVAVNGNAASVGQTITLASGATVKLNSNGTFDYDPNGKFDNLAAGGSAIDTFTYRISDGHGGFDTTVVKIRVNASTASDDESEAPVNGKPAISGTTSVAVDEEGLTTPHNGNAGDSYAWGDLPGQTVVAHGTLGVSFGPDGPKDGGGFALWATGATWNPQTTTLRADDGSWKIVVDKDGCYTFTLMKPMTHPVAGNEDDICIDVGFSATDKSLDKVCGSFQLKVDDDAPVICNPTSVKVDEEGLTKGNPGDSYPSGDLPGQALVAQGTLGISFGADGPTEGAAIVLSAPCATWDQSCMTLRADDGSWKIVVSEDGCYTFTLMKPMTHPVGGNEDDLCIDVSFTATDADCDKVCGSFQIKVDDDAPVICNPTSVKVDEEGLTKPFQGNPGDSYAWGDLPGQAVVATGTLGVSFGADGPKAGGGFHLSADCATWNPATMTLRADDGSWKIVVDQDGCYTFVLMKPMHHAVSGNEDDICIDVSFVATDRDCDSVCGSFQIKVDDDAPEICNPTCVRVDEEGLCRPYEGNWGDSYAWGDMPGHAVTATGSLGVSFGADGPKSGVGLALSAPGATWNPQTMTLCANDGSWKILVNEDGCYTFVLLKPMHHPVAGNEDDICIDVSFTATDADCDSVCGSFQVKIDDDAPVVCNEIVSKVLDDEAQLFGIDGGPGDEPGANLKSVSGQLDFSAGADGLAKIAFGEHVGVTDSQGANAGALRVVVVDPLTKAEHEEVVSLHWTQSGAGGTLIGTSASYPDAGNPVLMLTVDAVGNYTFQVYAPLAHPLTDNPGTPGLESEFEDELTLSLGFTITDKDCDPVCGTFTVKIDDDSPDPQCDVATVRESGNDAAGVASGNVLENDAMGADGFGGLVAIVIDGVTYDFVESANKITKDGVDFALATSVLNVTTALGGSFTLYFLGVPGHAAGDWSYQSPVDVDADTTEILTYKIVDGDGDGQTAELKIKVEDAPEVAPPSLVVTKVVDADADGEFHDSEAVAEGVATLVTYKVTIQNTSNSQDPVTITSIADDQVVNDAALLAAAIAANGGSDTLAPGASLTFTYTATLTLDDEDEVINQVDVSGEDDEGTPVSDDDTATVTATGGTPSLVVTKVVDADADGEFHDSEAVAEGVATLVTYQVTIQNTSNSQDPVTITSIADDQVVNDAALLAAAIAANGGSDTLAPGASLTFTYTATLTLDDEDEVINQVDVSGEDDEGTPVSDDDTATVTATGGPPSLVVTKVVDADADGEFHDSEAVAEGVATLVTYQVTIQNTSNSQDPVTITSIADDQVVNDAALLAAAIAANGGSDTLAPGASLTFTYTATLTLDDEDEVINQVDVSGEDDEGTPVSDDDTATVTSTGGTPSLVVTKVVDADADGEFHDSEAVAEGVATLVTYKVTIQNTSNSQDPVTITSIADDQVVNDAALLAAAIAANGGSDTLAPGASLTFTYTATLTLDDEDQVINQVDVSGEDDEGTPVSDDDTATVTATGGTPSLVVTKVVDADADGEFHDSEAVAEGVATLVTYQVTIQNTSNSQDPVTITSIADDQVVNDAALLAAAIAANGGSDTLAPGASLTFTYTATLTLDDEDQVINQVDVSGEDDEGTPVTDDDTATVTATGGTPSLVVTKVVDADADGEFHDSEAVAEGVATLVTYKVTIQNTSNSQDPVTITSIADDQVVNDAALLAAAIAANGGSDTLAPGASLTFTYTATLTLDDEDQVINQVDVSGEDDEGTPVTDDDTATVTATDTVPEVGARTIVADEDQLPAGNNDLPSASPGDDAQSNLTGNLPINFFGDAAGATISFAGLSGDPVEDTLGDPVLTSATNSPLTYYWNGTDTLYASTDTSTPANAIATAAFKLTITNHETATYTFELIQALEHPGGVGPDDNTENPNLQLSLAYTATDGDGDPAPGVLGITIDDDIPIAENNTREVEEGTLQTVDVVLIVDVSGSMNDTVDDVPDFSDNRLGLARYSMRELIEENLQIQNVLFIKFSSDSSSEVWMSRTDALAYINNNGQWSPDGATNYDAALNETMTAYGASTRPLGVSDNTVTYFMSDGIPTISNSNPGFNNSGSQTNPELGDGIGEEGINGGDLEISRQEWEAFVTGNGISDVFGIGIGTGVNASNLEPISYPNTDGPDAGTTEDRVIVVSDSNVDALLDTMQDFLGNTASIDGNVLLDDPLSSTGADAYGADGGYIKSITIDGTTYTFNGVGTVAVTGADPGAQLLENNGTSIKVLTDNGGTLTFYFAIEGINPAGSWSFLAPDNVNADTQEVFPYVIVDNDGDEVSANLSIEVLNLNSAPVNTVPVTQSTNEDQSKVIAGLSIADSDAGAGSVTVTLSATNGVLNVTGGPGVSGSGTNIVTIIGTVAAINAILSAANAVTYVPTGDFNGSATLTMVTNDNGNTGAGGALSDTDAVTINVAAVNDPPTATITPPSYDATEQTNLNLHGTGLSVADIDAGANPISITLSVTSGILTLAVGSTGATIGSGNGTSSVVVNGTLAQLNALLAGTGGATIVFNANSDTPPASATLTLLVDDTGDTGSGGALTASDTATINIAAVPDAPQISLDSTQNVRDEFGTAAYSNNNGSANWGGNWTEAGDDGSATSGEIEITGGQLHFDGDIDGGETITRAVNLANVSAATLTFDYNQATDANENIVVEAWNGSSWEILGTLPGSDPDGTGSFSAALTAAQIGAHTQVRFRVDGEDWDTSGTDDSFLIDNVNIAFTATQAGHTAAFTEGGAAVAIATADSLVTDPDSANMASGSVVLTNKQVGDQFRINGSVVSNGSSSTFSGVNYTVTDNGTTITIAMTNSASKANYEAFIEAVTFENTSENPVTTNRIVNVTVNDGASNSNTAVATISVAAVNDAPVVSGLTVSETSIAFSVADVDDTSVAFASPFAAVFPAAVLGANALTPAQQASEVTGTLQVTDGDDTVSVVGLSLGTSGNNSFTAGASSTALYGFGGTDTLTGGAAADWIFGGAANDTINGAQNDNILDGGAATDTLNVGAAFTSTSDAQIANIEIVTVTAAVALDLSNQTENLTINAFSSGHTINAGTGGDTVNVSAGTTATAWTVDLGNDAVKDRVVFSHAGVGIGDNAVATVSNFKVANDSVAVTVNGTAEADGAFQTLTVAAAATGEVIELVNNSWVTASLTTDTDGGAVEAAIAAAIVAIAGGTYTVIVYSSNAASADAGIYTMTLGGDGGDNDLQTGEFSIEHIMTLSGVGYGNLGDGNFGTAADPIILDLQPDGVSFTSIGDGVQFDINADGELDQMAWTASADGILTMDLDGSGAIENGSEVLSEFFAGGGHADGLAALTSLDDNDDGVIDSADAAFAELLAWQDLDHDGVSDAGELKSLSELGIASISLAAAPGGGEIDGQIVVANGTFTYDDGSSGNFVEVDFDATLGSPDEGPLVGEAGVADIFRFEDAGTIREVIGYNESEGDTIDLATLLDAAFAEGGDAGDFVQLSADGDDIQVFVDIDGTGDGMPAHIASLLGANTAGDDPVRVSFGGQTHVFTV